MVNKVIDTNIKYKLDILGTIFENGITIILATLTFSISILLIREIVKLETEIVRAFVLIGFMFFFTKMIYWTDNIHFIYRKTR